MKKKILILALAILVVGGLGLTAFSYAQAASPVEGFLKPQGWGSTSLHPHGERGEGPLRPYIEEAAAEVLGISAQDLADALEDGVRMRALIEEAGLTVDEFAAAMEAALPEIVDQALADGAITQEQADRILANGFPKPRNRMGPLAPYVLEATADILGMDVEALEEALESGVRMNELLDDAGMTHLEFRQALDAATPEIVRLALADEAITEEAADRILEFGLPIFKCRAGRHGRGRHGGPGGGFGPNRSGGGLGPMGPAGPLGAGPGFGEGPIFSDNG